MSAELGTNSILAFLNPANLRATEGLELAAEGLDIYHYAGGLMRNFG